MKKIKIAGVVFSGLLVMSGLQYSFSQENMGKAGVSSIPLVVARVNGVDISGQSFWQKLLSVSGNQVLTVLVDDILIDQEAKKIVAPNTLKNFQGKLLVKNKGMTYAQALDPEVEQRLKELKKQVKENSFDQELKKLGLTEEDVKKTIQLDLYKVYLLQDRIESTSEEAKKYFDENKERLATPEQIRLKHILVATEQEAKDLMLALKVGANFDLLAKEKSLDTASKDRGGDIGYFNSGMLSAEIQQKLFALEIDKVDLMKISTGFSVVKVIEKKLAKAAVWDKVLENNIRQALRQEKFNQEYPKYVEELRSRADIKVLLGQ